jgi:4-alpha-glucanotransferase
VRYPLEDLLRIIALESRRNDCIVVGEDLGTVPEGFRPRLAQAGVLSCRVLLFEREADGSYRPPNAYPREALVSASTHDLPTLAGYWSGNDLLWRRRRGLLGDEDTAAAAEAERAADRRRLLEALAAAGLLPPELSSEAPPATLTPALNRAVHAFLGRTPGRIVMVQIEDMLRAVEQANLPGTTEEHPNWRRRLDLSVDAVLRNPEVAELAAALRASRERPAL